MNLCSNGHDEVCYEGRECPACLIASDRDAFDAECAKYEQEIAKLEEQIAELDSIISELQDNIKGKEGA